MVRLTLSDELTRRQAPDGSQGLLARACVRLPAQQTPHAASASPSTPHREHYTQRYYDM